MAETAGTKRPHSNATSDAHANKKRKVQRTLQHVACRPQHVEPAPQEPVFVQSQLLKSITAALTMAGFDSVKPTALEMFRGAAEEYMLNFLHHVRTSMQSNRRTSPTALDFASALALVPNTSSASLLKPLLGEKIPESISSPSIPDPDPAPPAAPDFSSLLQPLVTAQPPSYIPKHFPSLPPKHAWRHTSVYADREHDARKMRERATEEGMLAEQALRKLAAAAKSGAVKAERMKENAISEVGRKAGVKGGRRQARRGQGAEQLYGQMLKDIAGTAAGDEDEGMDLGLDGINELREEGIDPGMPEGVVVNWDIAGWRRGARKHHHYI
ncbi:transcription factor TFIID complex subunit 8 C-term-domain-containing protein [Neohortaea acidophila]|uniref:Transcription initiation factor TFIID subunit 8 n=1 Tax=Neohortaea acidophila TaxID=245834 RepID=A0A6A6PZ34_9PEZI|nr:transcription factor TFIID complex subunit 8 C-term-domain-containing protein [Neohortaea acidophila]KAF2485272.1 transcription factor TFIID complex subunit 8 C-term-domain-containing protein [Neohortaea acidophila]